MATPLHRKTDQTPTLQSSCPQSPPACGGRQRLIDYVFGELESGFTDAGPCQTHSIPIISG
jgi:hypothetical protein